MVDVGQKSDTERFAMAKGRVVMMPSTLELIQKGGFPEFVLQPINFDALYLQSKQQQAAAQAEDAEKH